jgi:BioD-like phosphotransacetylase family protein
MLVLYITSLSEKAGKTLLCSGLGKIWTNKGMQVGYLKPLIAGSDSGSIHSDKDLIFMQKILNFNESLESVSPTLSDQVETGLLVKQACVEIARQKDIVLIEGLPLNKSSSLIEALDARVIIIHDYSNSLADYLENYRKLGSRLIGVVLNKVPKNQVTRIRSSAANELSGAGINMLGVLPEDRLISSMSISDLAESIQGKILNNGDKSEEIIENFMMGSSTFDRGATYYNRKNNKAVILWGERPGFRKAALSNLQLAAVQTSVKCIVIGNNAVPIPAVAQKSEEKQVPLISAPGDMKSLVSVIENGMSNLKFTQEKKIPRLLEMIEGSLSPQLLTGVIKSS